MTAIATTRNREDLGASKKTRLGNAATRRVVATEFERRKNAVSPPHNWVSTIFFGAQSQQEEEERALCFSVFVPEMKLQFSLSTQCHCPLDVNDAVLLSTI